MFIRWNLCALNFLKKQLNSKYSLQNQNYLWRREEFVFLSRAWPAPKTESIWRLIHLHRKKCRRHFMTELETRRWLYLMPRRNCKIHEKPIFLTNNSISEKNLLSTVTLSNYSLISRTARVWGPPHISYHVNRISRATYSHASSTRHRQLPHKPSHAHLPLLHAVRDGQHRNDSPVGNVSL